MPPQFRISGPVAARLLGRWFPADETLLPSADLSRGLAEYCSNVGIVGGAVYDALVALTAAEGDATLVTADERAANTYRRLGVAFELAT
jgi:toxin FitB